jgi:Spy/CpxP family protein refolding chaperone
MIRVLVRAAAIAALSLSLTWVTASAQPPGGRPMNPRREALERQLRMRTGEMVRRQLQLNDDQMARLQATNQQFERQRIALIAREREVRRKLRREIMLNERANQNHVSELLDQAFEIERQRFDLLQTEQRELAKFLTPVQRAKLVGIQSELRRRTQQMRGRPSF